MVYCFGRIIKLKNRRGFYKKKDLLKYISDIFKNDSNFSDFCFSKIIVIHRILREGLSHRLIFILVFDEFHLQRHPLLLVEFSCMEVKMN